MTENKKIKDLTGKVIGNYKVLELIAEGGFGRTYKGEHINLSSPVCIKHPNNLSEKDEKILRQEAKTLWDLRHYGIPVMRDYVNQKDIGPMLVMSYIPGYTLEKIVEKLGKLNPEHVAWMMERSFNVLKYLHYNGVVHGDVKPQNIIIQKESHNVVLVDYGLSLVHPSNKSLSRGYTPYFAPPESKNQDPLIPESDFYGLGMTMIYALGGDVSNKRIPRSVPNPLIDFIKRLVVYDPLSRPCWQDEDITDTISDLRIKTFGRRHSKMLEVGRL